MATETQKRAFVTSFKEDITRIVQAIEKGETAIEIFIDKNYGTGGDDAITDEILEILGTTMTDLLKGKTLIDNLVKFRDDILPDKADYGETFSKLRTDFGARAGTE